ncbi:YfbM family protein [Paenibacillus eucommiae]|uniref:Ribosomal protein S17E n=1 Tax=Paenibacillus eucommiae TaxID=1355755 RepID=A0ABS4JA42_9BACL|nr:YfbM family protein [Paenibacillus eucommiae]MBP1996712.1 ribosomal protein S17E [Paenibacillus eucommiae]
MGMIGLYKAVPEHLVKKLAAGDLTVEELISFSGEELDIDKAWQGIHYVLTGKIMGGDQPLGNVVPMLDDQGMDLHDFGAFYLYPEQVKAAIEAISEYSQEQFSAKFEQNNPIQEQVYPVGSDEDYQEFLDYLYQYFTAIQSFYRSIAAAGNGVIFYIV